MHELRRGATPTTYKAVTTEAMRASARRTSRLFILRSLGRGSTSRRPWSLNCDLTKNQANRPGKSLRADTLQPVRQLFV